MSLWTYPTSVQTYFFEAWFAHGLGKLPIYIARERTRLHFNLKDYPIIFFKSYVGLKNALEQRLSVLASKAQVPAK